MVLESTSAPNSGVQSPSRDHLFISYAFEDRALAEWLTRKLTAEGYRVWCDRFALLAGESYPIKIDEAIKERTFRVIALLSSASINKPNPTKERTLALNLARERKESFLIPLNVDLTTTQLDWMTSDLHYVSFSNWANGLTDLLKLLTKISTPRPLQQQGRSSAIETFLTSAPIRFQKEFLYTNCIPFIEIPPTLRAFSTNRNVGRDEFMTSVVFKKAYRVNPRTYLSFGTLAGIGRDAVCQPAGIWLWGDDIDIFGVPSLNIVSTLLSRTFVGTCMRKGLLQTSDGKSLYFPNGLFDGDRIHFDGFTGKTWLLVAGQRLFRKLEGQQEICVYHLSFRFRVRRNLFSRFVIQLRVGLHLTDLGGSPFKPRTFNARRKKITKNWWNDKWLNRHLAICQFLTDADGKAALNDSGEPSITLSTQLIRAEAPFGIAEDLLGADREEFQLVSAESEILDDEPENEPSAVDD
ncbi:MAG TPA: toll/interleukin-1 receptor domain-containing protein [Chthoniobacterales bacterium]|nr:toll/interleukin-1 receptor domain-containing protein [Chthoniobacterales bacterium]